MDVFDIGESKTRVGVLTYSDTIYPVINLDSFYAKDRLNKMIDRIPHLTGGTKTGSAIQYIRETGFSKHNARPGVAHIAIILTDGQSEDTESTATQAKLAHEAGIYLFAIGIGRNTDAIEMKTIASDPDHRFVFSVDNYDALNSVRDILAVSTCDGKMFIVLSSISIWYSIR